MRVSQHVVCAIDDIEGGKFDSALMHACIAIDATAKRIPGASNGVGNRYRECLRYYYWIIEPMIGTGINLVDTRFDNIQLRGRTPDFADLIYEVFRCSHAHGDEVPPEFSVLPTRGPYGSEWLLGKDELHMPDRVVWALLAVVVFAQVNGGEKTTGAYYLSIAEQRFLIRDWWGREDEFRTAATRYNKNRVKFEGLDRLGQSDPNGIEPASTEHVIVVNPPFI
jgi:hypothetical protein